jgi:hypothetical protein
LLLLLEEVVMAELTDVHRYAAGGLIALALSQAQIQQQTAFGFVPPTTDFEDSQSQASTSSSSQALEEEGRVSWSSVESGLLRHIFRSHSLIFLPAPSLPMR